MSAAPVLAGAVLAKSGEAVKAGPIGLAVILLLGIACYFLFKSMSKHMREVRENFPATPPPPPSPARQSPAGDLPRAEIVPPAESPRTQGAAEVESAPPEDQPPA